MDFITVVLIGTIWSRRKSETPVLKKKNTLNGRFHKYKLATSKKFKHLLSNFRP